MNMSEESKKKSVLHKVTLTLLKSIKTERFRFKKNYRKEKLKKKMNNTRNNRI